MPLFILSKALGARIWIHLVNECLKEMKLRGNSKEVPWLRLSAFTVGARVQSLIRELRYHKSCKATRKEKKKILLKCFAKGMYNSAFLPVVYESSNCLSSAAAALDSIRVLNFFSSSHSKKCAVINMVVLPCISPMINDVKHLVMCL